MPAPVSALVGRHRSGELAPLLKQHREVKRAVGVTALIRSPVGGLSGRPIDMQFEQHTKV